MYRMAQGINVLCAPVRTSEPRGRSGQGEATMPKVCEPGENWVDVEFPRHIPDIVAGLCTSNCGAGWRRRRIVQERDGWGRRGKDKGTREG